MLFYMKPGMIDLQEVCNTNSAFKMGYSKVSPYFLARILPNMAAGHISMKYGFKVLKQIN